MPGLPIADHFPALRTQVHGKRLVYLDNAATTQKPLGVIEATDTYYRTQNANVHRGAHTLSHIATEVYEQARKKLARWIGAGETEVVFTRGTTESVNLLAYALGSSLKPGDRVLATQMEHHAVLVPWYEAARRAGASFEPVPVTDDGEVNLDALASMLDERVKLVAMTHISNVLGTVNPVRQAAEMAHAVGALVMVDGAQSLGHARVSVVDLGADFVVFSAHKAYGPTGIGALYGRADLLDALPPFMTGGGMIRTVAFDKVTYRDGPERFEAGTPNIAGAAGWSAALEFLAGLDLAAAALAEERLGDHLRSGLARVPGVRVLGHPKQRVGIVSFVAEWAHAHDVGTMLDLDGVAVRTGHHCCMPLMKRYGVAATTRASLAVYNTDSDVETCLESVRKAQARFDR